MGTIYERRGKLHIGFATEAGWKYRNTGLPPSERKAAAKMLEQIEAELARGGGAASSGKTVREYFESWADERKGTNAKADKRRLEQYVMPTIGSLQLREVRPKQMRALVRHLRYDKVGTNGITLASRTILSTWGLIHRLFDDALSDELIDATPCHLKRGDLPPKTDKNPEWRKGAVFTRDETEALISDADISLDCRVMYALSFLGGLRCGEMSALRWKSFDPSTEGLACLLVSASYTRKNGFEKATKSSRPREVPVHPALQTLLVQWRDQGFEVQFGRAPKADDLILPNEIGEHRTDLNVGPALDRDLKRLGLRHRTHHNLRRTFISLGRADGANRDVLKTVTHDQVGDNFDGYTTFPWHVRCEAVLCLKIELRPGKLLKIKKASGGNSPTGPSLTAELTSTEETAMQTAETTSESMCPRRDSKSAGSIGATVRTVDFAGRRPTTKHLRESEGPVFGSKLTAKAIDVELTETLADFRRSNNASVLGARLRVLLARIRGQKPKGGGQ